MERGLAVKQKLGVYREAVKTRRDKTLNTYIHNTGNLRDHTNFADQTGARACFDKKLIHL
jgi:hypothetical protein